MGLNLVKPEDFAAIQNLMAAYQHLVDAGDADGWSDLFTEDGAFLGLPPDIAPSGTLVGREELKIVPRHSHATFGGKFRHNVCSFSVRRGADDDEAIASYYMLGTMATPGGGAQAVMMVDVTTQLVRQGGEWKIKSNRMAMV